MIQTIYNGLGGDPNERIGVELGIEMDRDNRAHLWLFGRNADGQWATLADLKPYCAGAPVTVHLLFEGRALCGLKGLPRDWNADQKWVPYNHPNGANCAACNRIYTEMKMEGGR